MDTTWKRMAEMFTSIIRNFCRQIAFTEVQLLISST